MIANSDVFVKLNYKTIGEFKSLIIDRSLDHNEEHKYMMCAGNYNKDGWTFVFKANSVREAEELINNNKFKSKPVYNIKSDEIIDSKKMSNQCLGILETERVQIPNWM